MAIPDYQSIMLPLLKFICDGEEHSLRQSIETLANEFNLSDSERRELLPSGQQPIFDNRVGWARTYMKKAGLLKSTKRGYFKITERGVKALANKPSRIDVQFLKSYPEFMEFQTYKRETTETEVAGSKEESIINPEESLEIAYHSLRQTLATEILQNLKVVSPSRFEKIVVELIVKMGYGGSLKDAGQAIGGRGDEGIDGIIKEDRLGLDLIYIQAKRWEGIVGRPEIHKFTGALFGKRAKKGIFITTSNYSKEAREYVSNLDIKIILIDGEELAQYMIDHNIGVAPVSSYEVKRIDSDYFIEE